MSGAEVAVVMPAFQAARTIAAALASAQAQAVRAIEILVVDDGSRDDTAAIVARIAARDGRVRLLRQANAGPMAARNRGIAATSAPLVAPLDADDLWHPEHLAATIAALRHGRAGFAYALHHVIDAADRIVATPPLPLIDGDALYRHLLVNMVGCGSAALFRRDALIAAGGYDERTRAWGGAEDYLLQLRIAAEWPIACVARRLVGYRRVAASLSDDPLRMAGARRRAVGTVLDERGIAHRPILRWVTAEAQRTAAALLAMRGDWREAARPALAGLAGDPAAAIDDAVRRLRNRLVGRSDPGPIRFRDAAAPIEPPPMLPGLLGARLRRLALSEGRYRQRPQ